MRETKSPAAAAAERGAAVDPDTGSRVRSREARADVPAHAEEETTRMVTYESTVDGQLAPDATRATRRKLPGREMGWDAEDESTYVYATLEAEEPLRAPRQQAATVRSLMNAPVVEPARKQAARSAAMTAVQAPVPSAAVMQVPAPVQAQMPVRTSMPVQAPVPVQPAVQPAPSQVPGTRGDRRAKKTLSMAAMAFLPPDDPVERAVLVRKLAFAAVVLGAAVCVIAGVRALTDGAATSTVQLLTEPVDAQVTLDGVLARGSASPFVLSDVKLDAAHTIVVSKAGYRPWSTRITLHSDRPVLLPAVQLVRESSVKPPLVEPTRYAAPPPASPAGATLQRAATRSSLATRPAPRVKSNVQPKARAPRVSPAPVSTSAARPVTTARTATLRINSRPWSQVYVDGRLIGSTPQMQIVLPAGAHTVTLVNHDFGLKRVIALPLAPGQTVTKVVDLSH